MKGVVLSLFPGMDLLGRGFREEGFCVVAGPDRVLGGDVREFVGVLGMAEGIIGGPPCQDFSRKRRKPATGYGVLMLQEFLRIVGEVEPEWFLMENVEAVPDVTCRGYIVQRSDLNASECGLPQYRNRHIQFGSRDGSFIRPWRDIARCDTAPCVTASEGRQGRGRRSFEEVCRLQGCDAPALESFTVAGRYRLVGNGVPVPMARMLARAVKTRLPSFVASCACGCGRDVTPRSQTATVSCQAVTTRGEEPGAVPRVSEGRALSLF